LFLDDVLRTEHDDRLAVPDEDGSEGTATLIGAGSAGALVEVTAASIVSCVRSSATATRPPTRVMK
jgi:hypothetical protein